MRYNYSMTTKQTSFISKDRLQALAEVRYELRLFLHFSEMAAARHGLQPQQHQLLLQIAGAPNGVVPTIGYVAERLCLRHNSAVELSNRCEQAGLLARVVNELDRRQVALELTAKGKKILAALSIDHEEELSERAPELIRVLGKLPGMRERKIVGIAEGHR
jgi:DNA-binding MarR family transcriptional regulator